MSDSIFTQIITGAIPCHKVYEDDKTLAFMDIDPLLPGHVLVVSKLQINHVDDLPNEDYQALFATVKKVAEQIRRVLEAKRAVVLVMGYDVPHAHVHVIPCNTGRDFYEASARKMNVHADIEPDHPALAEIAKKLAF